MTGWLACGLCAPIALSVAATPTQTPVNQTLKTTVKPAQDPKKLQQSVPTSGGREAETVRPAESRVPGRLRHRERAVTTDDFKTLTNKNPGAKVGRATVQPKGFYQARTIRSALKQGEFMLKGIKWRCYKNVCRSLRALKTFSLNDCRRLKRIVGRLSSVKTGKQPVAGKLVWACNR